MSEIQAPAAELRVTQSSCPLSKPQCKELHGLVSAAPQPKGVPWRRTAIQEGISVPDGLVKGFGLL